MNIRYRPAYPYWVMLFIYGVLSLGAYRNNVALDGDFTDFHVLLAVLCTVVVRTIWVRRTVPDDAPLVSLVTQPRVLVRTITLVSIAMCSVHYAQFGVPILSGDPDTARMQFMASTWNFKLLKTFVPFLIAYLTATILLSRRKSLFDCASLLVLVALFALTGGKSAFVWAIFFVFLGFLTVGRLPSMRVTLTALVATLGITLILFKVVMGLASLADAISALYSRATEISEFGFYVAVHSAASSLPQSAPLEFVFKVFDKYFGSGGNGGYTASFGRLVTADFYGGDPYDFVWELTVTALGDFFVAGGKWGAVIGGVVWLWVAETLWNRGSAKATLYTRTLFFVLWYHCILMTLNGSIVTELMVRTLPLLLFWGAGFLCIHLGKAAVRPRPRSAIGLHIGPVR